jgi:large subunit ribosomal protein L6
MSRKATVPVQLPKGVEAKLTGSKLTIKGVKGTLEQDLLQCIELEMTQDSILVKQKKGFEDQKNFLGLTWSLISNMVVGVFEGFTKNLELIGVGYRAAVQGNLIDLQLGFSHPVKMTIPQGLEVKVEKNTNVSISGADKQVVGQFAADIRSKRPPEPYKGKGVRYKDEYVRRKAGKAGKK